MVILATPATHPVRHPVARPFPSVHAMRRGPRAISIVYEPKGAASALLADRSREVLLSGPAGTGKSYACLWKMHLAALKYPGMRGLIARKTRESLTQTGLVTFERKVLPPQAGVVFHHTDQAYRYPNGSEIVVGGLDKSSKVMSGEYDLIFVQEATELTEGDWEDLTTRLRNGVMPYQQLIADCNPQAPTHWLKLRINLGKTVEHLSRHEDNPELWDARLKRWTNRGLAYVGGVLDALTGVRKERLRYGRWAAAEGTIYNLDHAKHVTTRGAIAPIIAAAIEAGRTFGVGDWGWSNPGGLQVYARDGDGRLYLVAEHYHTHRQVDSWWLPRAQELDRQYGCAFWDLDPSEPAFIQKFRDAGLNARGADNQIAVGIDAVQDRLRLDATGRPRLLFCQDALLERDERLADLKQPTSALQEFDSYVWAKTHDGRSKDVPASGLADHGMDQVRYAVAAVDLVRETGVAVTGQQLHDAVFGDLRPYGQVAWESW